ELQSPAELLLPFEGLGVDTTWEFRLPRPSNPFDFDSISDIQFTIEYTALSDAGYREQVIAELDPTAEGDRVFSFRHQLPDRWYALHHPSQPGAPVTVRVTVRAEDFPPNLERESLRVRDVALHFSRVSETFELDVTSLRLGGNSRGAARSVNGTISTRRGAAP